MAIILKKDNLVPKMHSLGIFCCCVVGIFWSSYVGLCYDQNMGHIVKVQLYSFVCRVTLNICEKKEEEKIASSETGRIVF